MAQKKCLVCKVFADESVLLLQLDRNCNYECHVACFYCMDCNAGLDFQNFVICGKREKLLCLECYADGIMDFCWHCGKTMTSDFVKISDCKFHPSCGLEFGKAMGANEAVDANRGLGGSQTPEAGFLNLSTLDGDAFDGEAKIRFDRLNEFAATLPLDFESPDDDGFQVMANAPDFLLLEPQQQQQQADQNLNQDGPNHLRLPSLQTESQQQQHDDGNLQRQQQDHEIEPGGQLAGSFLGDADNPGYLEIEQHLDDLEQQQRSQDLDLSDLDDILSSLVQTEEDVVSEEQQQQRQQQQQHQHPTQPQQMQHKTIPPNQALLNGLNLMPMEDQRAAASAAPATKMEQPSSGVISVTTRVEPETANRWAQVQGQKREAENDGAQSSKKSSHTRPIQVVPLTNRTNTFQRPRIISIAGTRVPQVTPNAAQRQNMTHPLPASRQQSVIYKILEGPSTSMAASSTVNIYDATTESLFRLVKEEQAPVERVDIGQARADDEAQERVQAPLYSLSSAKQRAIISSEHRQILEEAFRKDMFPNKQARMMLGFQTKLDARQVQIWFQNQRSKAKKMAQTI